MIYLKLTEYINKKKKEFEDHHCIWLNNCVGKRNYRPFFTFITVCVILCVFVIAFDIYQLFLIFRNNPEEGFGFVLIQSPVSFALIVYCFILLWMVGGLTVYHCTLIVRGVTTHEQVSNFKIYSALFLSLSFIKAA